MLKTMDATSNFIRAVVSLFVACAVSVGGWLGYSKYYKNEMDFKEQQRMLAENDETIKALHKDVALKAKEIDRLDTAVRLLKVDHRVAQLVVEEQELSPKTGKLVTKLRFQEVNDKGQPLDAPKRFIIDGDLVYVDAWVAKFLDEFVEQGDDPLRSTSICLFRRLFGADQTPNEGFPLDAVGSRPAAYSKGSEPSDLEQEIWTNFWDFANDPKKAEAAGIRAAHGEAPSIKVKKGKLYKVMLRSSGGLTITPEDLPPDAAL